jgi:hypothetical protein
MGLNRLQPATSGTADCYVVEEKSISSRVVWEVRNVSFRFVIRINKVIPNSVESHSR